MQSDDPFYKRKEVMFQKLTDPLRRSEIEELASLLLNFPEFQNQFLEYIDEKMHFESEWRGFLL